MLISVMKIIRHESGVIVHSCHLSPEGLSSSPAWMIKQEEAWLKKQTKINTEAAFMADEPLNAQWAPWVVVFGELASGTVRVGDGSRGSLVDCFSCGRRHQRLCFLLSVPPLEDITGKSSLRSRTGKPWTLACAVGWSAGVRSAT